jgi:PAS domain-containing protein
LLRGNLQTSQLPQFATPYLSGWQCHVRETQRRTGATACEAMQDHRKVHRSRSFKGGKILINNEQSVIDCTIRNLSPEGANLQVGSAFGIPAFFDLLVDGRTSACDVIWKAGNRVGVAFSRPAGNAPAAADVQAETVASQPQLDPVAFCLRAALDEVRLGIVLLDATLQAQFINRAFRVMWCLPDAKAESRPAFVTLMYHGRDTRAYDVPESELTPYVEARVAHVRKGDQTPIDLRLRSGEIIRFQCAKLPTGGRMLTYTDVTDIVRRTDELERLRAALDTVDHGIVLLDGDLKAEFLNLAARRMWQIPDELAAAKPDFRELVANTRKTNLLGMTEEPIAIYLEERLARVRKADSRPMDIRRDDGRVIRAQCTALANGGRMLTYTEVTDLVDRADAASRTMATSWANSIRA